jgi:hypothetical protein
MAGVGEEDAQMSGVSTRELVRSREVALVDNVPDDVSVESVEEDPPSNILIFDNTGATMHQLHALLKEKFPDETFEILTKLPRGGIRVKVENPEPFLKFQFPEQLSHIKVTTQRNKQELEERTVVLKGVPTWIDNDDFNSDARIISTKRITRKDGKAGTTVFIITKTLQQAQDICRVGRLRMFGNSWSAEPYANSRRVYCRTCKTVKPKHNPGLCTRIRCGICSGAHATKQHPQEDVTKQCPRCSKDDHQFKDCPEVGKAISAYRKSQTRNVRVPTQFQTTPTPRRAQEEPPIHKHDEASENPIFIFIKILLALDIIPEAKRSQVEGLLSQFVNPHPTYAEVLKTTDSLEKAHMNLTPNPDSVRTANPRKKPRNLTVQNDEEKQALPQPSLGWRQRRACKFNVHGCTKVGTSGPITIHEKDCKFQHGPPDPSSPSPSEDKNVSSHKIQEFFKTS